MNIRDVEIFADVDLFDGFAVELFFKSSHCMSTFQIFQTALTGHLLANNDELLGLGLGMPRQESN